jgi:ABC-2 type transport system ATP-binding protein
MSEVEAVCDRVIIIAKGRIAVDERLESLRRENTILVEARGPSDAIRSALGVLPGVQQVSVVSQSDAYATLEVVPRNEMDPREAIAQKLVSSGWPPRMLETRRGSLEERFVEAVTRENRVNDLVEVVAS